MCFFLVYWIKIYNNELVEFDEFVLDKQVNYASDAAIEELLLTGHTSQDYSATDYLAVEPELALKEFTSILGTCFNFTPTDYTRTMIENTYIKAFLVCAWDGIYAYWHQPINDKGEYALVATPKIPYFYTDPKGKQYCLTLGLEEAFYDSYIPGDPAKYSVESRQSIAGQVDKEVQLTAINNRVADLLNYALTESYGGSSRTSYEIPAIASEVSGAQPVDSITVIGIVEGKASVGTSSIVAECIGGAQVTQTDYIQGVKARINGTVAYLYANESYWRKIQGTLPDEYNIEFEAKDKTNGPWTKNFSEAKTKPFDSPFEAATNNPCYYNLYSTFETIVQGG